MGALASLLARLDGGARPGVGPPRRDATQFPRAAWDLRTLIVVFGPDAPLRFLNLNLTLGLTGLPFDQHADGLEARDAFDLQLCLEGRGRAALCKRTHSIRGDVRFTPGAARVALGDLFDFDGAWPHFLIRFRQPNDALELELDFDAAGPLQHWAHAGRIYSHYTSFGTCRGTWRWGDQRGDIDSPALLDHGFGRRARAAGRLLRRFRYEVLRLPDGAAAIGLVTEAPGGVVLRRAGVVREVAADFEHEVARCERFANHAGAMRAVPSEWVGRLVSPAASLEYRARRATPPRAVLGDGFLTGFDYDAEGTGALPRRFSGEGYAEQLGVRGG